VAERQQSSRHNQAARRPSPGPDPGPGATTDLADQVLVALSAVPVWGLTVSALSGGVVELDGTVQTEARRHEAERLARAVPGVAKVANALLVDPLVDATGSPDGDLSPQDRAEIGVEGDALDEGTEIDLNEEIGTTDPMEATDEALPYFPPTDPPIRPSSRDEKGFEVTGGFSGTALDDPIDPEQPPVAASTGDDEIARLVRLALEEDAATADLAIRVAVRDGVVYLHGVVPSLTDAELAEEVAGRVPDVVEVQEHLEVAGE
jgi:osmotically-inducible protein OsmY